MSYSDMIRINLSNGHELVMRKGCVKLSKGDGRYRLVTGLPSGDLSGFSIEETEYNRLCKKLGIDDE